MRWLRFDGTAVEVEVSASALIDGEGISVQVFVRDITERKQAQRHILRLTELYSALSRTSQAVARLRDRDALFAEVCSIASEFEHVAATWHRPRSILPGSAWCRSPRAARARNTAGTSRWSLQRDRAADDDPIAAALARGPRVCLQRPRRRSAARGSGALRRRASRSGRWRCSRSGAGGTPVGAITHYADELGYFDAELTELLNRMAGEISLALERFASEAALLDKQRQMEILLGNLPGMVYRCRDDPDWTMEFVSEGCLELTGYQPEELMLSRAVTYEGITHPADRARVREEIRRALAARSRFALEYRIRTRDGREKWVRRRGSGSTPRKASCSASKASSRTAPRSRPTASGWSTRPPTTRSTGLANRYLLNDRMRQAIAHAQRLGTVMAVVFLDLDQFKFVNDTLGHTAGDELLKHAAERSARLRARRGHGGAAGRRRVRAAARRPAATCRQSAMRWSASSARWRSPTGCSARSSPPPAASA